MSSKDDNMEPAYVRFKNNTCYSIELNWMDKFKEKSYCVLAPYKCFDVNTYTIHPWVFRECMSKSKMLVAGKDVFIARSWVEEHRRLKFSHSINVPLRIMVNIDMPVLALRQLCLIQIASVLKYEEDVALLEIPDILQKELSEMLINKESCKNPIND